MTAPSIRLHQSRLEGPHSSAKVSYQKLPGLDWLRAAAAIGVVLLHACVPYLQHPMPGLQWSVEDQSSLPVDCVFWAVEVFIMPVFLVLAGFFAWHSFCRRGPAIVLQSRAKRLLVPLAFGALVVLPIDLYIWIIGWIAEGLVSPVKLRSLKFSGSIGENVWGLSHLWFLQYLFLYVAAFSMIASVAKSPVIATIQKRLPSLPTWGSSLGLIVAGAMILSIRPEVVWGFQHTFAPVPSKWLYSGLFFFGGLLIAAVDPELQQLKRLTPRLIPLAMLFLTAAVVLGRWHLGEVHRIEGAQLANHSIYSSLVLGFVTVLAAWLVTLSLVGTATAYFRDSSTRAQYLAAASFWVYLVHHPLLGLAHIDLKWLLPTAPPVLKMALAFSVSLAVSLITYEVLVRKTALGQMLGFGWKSPSAVGEMPDDKPEANEERRTAA